ncbi:type II secretion system protein GspM [Parachitinimonas caeni]|uniref:Type II secretion system protein GspM n=1 Tax=Parachitinimonas caeni TaxID=3031301 RepID=A0ABT7DW66_9NEIS|nr:type II secretion system protein GspM [Parachitinimonas caeni]MDK2123400.1 type II secretion system protein GspM [Parachitinimonas caeni]
MTIKQKLLNAWQQRQPRERMILAGGAGIALIGLLYAYGIHPLLEDSARLKRQLPRLRADTAEIKGKIQQFAGKPAATTLPTGPLLDQLKSMAATHGLQDSKLDWAAKSPAEATMRADHLSFDGWLAFAGAAKQEGVKLTHLTAEALGEPGMVKIEAVFAR